jgi:glycerate-2-kinase
MPSVQKNVCRLSAEPPRHGRTIVIGAGKGAAAMAHG